MALSRIIVLILVYQLFAVDRSAGGAEALTPTGKVGDSAPAAKRQRQTKITLSKETTRISEPLTADGYPDYVEHLNRRLSQGVTPQNNAVALLWQVVGPKEVDAEIRKEYFRRLAVSAPPAEGDYLLEPLEYAKQAGLLKPGDDERLAAQFEDSYCRPWTEKDYPVLAKWLAASQQPLKLAIEMTRRPRHYAPLVSTSPSFRIVNLYMPSIQTSRRIGRALVSRAMLRLSQNKGGGSLGRPHGRPATFALGRRRTVSD